MIVMFACSNVKERDSVPADKLVSDYEDVELMYAEGFTIKRFENYTLITVHDPWQGAENIEYNYQLVKKGQKCIDLPGVKKIVVPIDKVVCLSTTHTAIISLLGRTESIVGVSGTKYVNNIEIQSRITEGKILDVGFESSLSYETIASVVPDLVIAYGVGSGVTNYDKRLNDLGILTVMNAEYLESHPLGKTEWIKFIAEFYDLGELADSIFNVIAKEYIYYTSSVINLSTKPKVLVGAPWKGTWYIPGGNSYIAKLIEDAGGNYLWKDNESRESFPIDIEVVFDEAKDADIWINIGSSGSKKGLIDIDERFASFDPLLNGKLYNNDSRITEDGGNDFWESGIVNPHIILKDLISIFHSDSISEQELYFYQRFD